MSELRFPNESKAYRDARDALLKEERELAEKVKAVAAKRRELPDGGQLKEDYVFQWASGGKVGQRVKFSELFGDKDTLLLYSFMFGPSWDKPCPSCTSLMDGFDRSWYQVSRDAAFAGIAKAPAEKINAWAKERGWSQIPLLSGYESTFQKDYECQGTDPGETDDDQQADACVQETRWQDFSFLERRGRRRYGVALLESDGLYPGRPAGSADAAAKLQAGIF